MKLVKSHTHNEEPTVDVFSTSEGYAVDCYHGAQFFGVYESKKDALDMAQAMHNRAIRSL